jgi:Cu+-exporting ATPase
MIYTPAAVELVDRIDEDAGCQTDITQAPACFHCGTACGPRVYRSGENAFCCQGCQIVFELLRENGLGEFYRLSETAGVRVRTPATESQFRFLDEPAVRERLVDFSDARITRVTFHAPAIHCIACVWLLENLFRLKPGIGRSQVHFPRKEVTVAFDTARVKLSDVVTLLASLGYEPELKLSALESKPRRQAARRLWIQLGLAGFAFGNIMLFSISDYLGLDAFAGPGFRQLTGGLSLLLALPVVTYSMLDYWRAARTSLRQRRLNIDVPIAVGVLAIFAQSTADVLLGRGNGYFDSLCGLIFFLLCGKLFQQKTYDRLAFDRDYKSFFPLSVTRKQDQSEQAVSLSKLAIGDRLVIRHGELIPADARLTNGRALIDYSFVTGESEPVAKEQDCYLYAGGRQLGGAIEVETVKAVSHSYLASLWDQDAFRKEKGGDLNQLTNAYSRRFTKLVIAVACGAAAYWAWANPALSLKAFTSVLIVACPCALALAAPFTLGSAQRVLARRHVFLKNPSVLEALAKVNAIVFDKTGTLTSVGAGQVAWHGEPLMEIEALRLGSLARHSAHPLAVRISDAIAPDRSDAPVRSFVETAGCGMAGSVAGREILMGTAVWLDSRGVRVPVGAASPSALPGSVVHVAIGGKYRGCFTLSSAVRPETERLIAQLSNEYELALLTGDNEKERATFNQMFGSAARVHFHQNPLNKLEFIRDRQRAGRTVLMAGDGLNDAGALKQSDVGVAVVETISAFSPASNVILTGAMVPRLGNILRYARQSVRIVQTAFLLSAIYNLAGISIAAAGKLSPIVCAVLMPLSSVSVVALACGATTWLGRTLKTESRP